MADGRLRLMWDELNAMRVRQCRAPHQPSDATHLDDVGLHHANTGRDQIRQASESVGLLAGRDCDVKPAGDLTHRLDVVVLHRLLKPPIAELLQYAPDAYGTTDRVAVIGIKSERETVADKSPHRACLSDVARNVDIGLGPVVVKADLHRCGLVFEPGFDNPQHLVDTALAITANRSVKRQPGAPSAAQ